MESGVARPVGGEPREASVRAVLRTALVLKAFSDGSGEFGVNELSRRLGLSPATIYRIVSTLAAEGFLEQDPSSGRYRLGTESLFLGLACLNRKHLGTECLPVMRQVAASTGESVNLGVLWGDSVIYVQQVESPQPLRFARSIGTHIPLHCTALGKLLLGFLPEARQRQLLESVELTRFTPSTITDREELLQHLRSVRERGHAVTDEEYIPDLRGLAVPVRDHSGEVIAGLSIMGPSSRLTLVRLEAYGPEVAGAGLFLSRQLGWRQP